jgi:hypothetical protein
MDHRLSLAALLLVASFVAACGAGTQPPPTPPPFTILPGDGAIVPIHGQHDPRPVALDELRADVDGRRVVVTARWTSGVAPCYVLDSVSVTTTGTTIEITLREGSADPDAVCIMLAESKMTRIDLGELSSGTWTIRDGAGGAAPIEVVVG